MLTKQYKTMKSLKLKKVKISKIGNPHILFGGADAAQGAQQAQYPVTTGKDTKLDGDCITGTNGGSIGRTDRKLLEPANSGIQN
jgi:hypothetical protein